MNHEWNRNRSAEARRCGCAVNRICSSVISIGFRSTKNPLLRLVLLFPGIAKDLTTILVQQSTKLTYQEQKREEAAFSSVASAPQ